MLLPLLLLAGFGLAARSKMKAAAEAAPPVPEPDLELDESILAALPEDLHPLGLAMVDQVLRPLIADLGQMPPIEIRIDDDGVGLVAVLTATSADQLDAVVDYVQGLDLPIDELRVSPGELEVQLVYGSAQMADQADEPTEEAAK